MSRDTAPNPAYPNGLTGILDQWNARRAPLSFAAGETLWPLDVDLNALSDAVVPPPGPKPENPSGHTRKVWEIARELKGQNALLHVNGVLIAHLRKRSQPAHTAALFQRLWAEHTDLMLPIMDLRWKVSSLATFGDHGVNVVQRSAGLGLATLFGTMKLYESERLFSGRDPDRPFTLDGRSKARLPLEMDAFSLSNGGLDVNMIARLWDEAAQDPVIKPLAHDMLQRLIDDPRTVFRRLHRLRARKQRRESQEASGDSEARKNVHLPVPKSAIPPKNRNPSWGLVCTTNAPFPEVVRWVAHHLDIGSSRIFLFLDTPNPDATALLAPNPKVEVVECDAAYWSNLGKERPDQHQLRQSFNATRALQDAEGMVDWIGHIDVDEFVLSDTPFARHLKSAPDEMAAMRLLPAEGLAVEKPGSLPKHFKLGISGPGAANALQDAYPTFGSYLRAGFLSHTAGKIFARTGLGDARLKIHRLRQNGQDVENVGTFDDIYLGHIHASDWQSFLSKLTFRKEKGSYRVKADEPFKSVGRLLAWLEEEEGEDGLRQLFEEMCLDTPDLRKRLQRNGLLLTPKFDPDRAVKRVFGAHVG